MNFIKTNINLQNEIQKWKDAALWNLDNGFYRIKLRSNRAPFKNGEAAIETSHGCISINDLFRHADEALKSLFFKDGSFVLNTEIELEIEMKNKGVVGVRKI
jgi:hypothetical protein